MNCTPGLWLLLCVCIGVMSDEGFQNVRFQTRAESHPAPTRVVTEVIINHETIMANPFDITDDASGISVTMQPGGRIKYKLIHSLRSNAVRLYYVKENMEIIRSPLLHAKVTPGSLSAAVDASIDISTRNGIDVFTFHMQDGTHESRGWQRHPSEDAVTIVAV